MQQDNLLPCPFCGGEPWVFESKYEDGVRLHNARCKSCHVAFDGCSTAKIAREKWNTRADLAQKTVTREEFLQLYLKAHRDGNNKHLVDDVYDELVAANIIRVQL